MSERKLELCLVAVALLASGCGSDDDSNSPSGPGSDRSNPTQVAQQFLAAAKSGHGREACSLMSERAIATTERFVKEGTDAGTGSQACTTFFIAFQTSGGGTLASLQIGRVSVNGDRAEAQVLCPPCRKQKPPLPLSRERGEWQVEFDPNRGY